MLIDTHTHIYMPDEFTDVDEVVARAREAGVGHMLLPNVDLTSLPQMVDLHARYPECTSVAVGLHPTEVKADFRQALDQIRAALIRPELRSVAVGEVGIDLYWDKTFRAEQLQAFEEQCRWALELDLPVIIHCREGLDEVLEVLRSLPAMPRAVFHSFGGTVADVERIRALGDFYFGINGIVTFKNSTLRDILPSIGIDRIILETDAPYLAPVPHRGRRNEPAYIPAIASAVASALSLPLSEVAARTTANAASLFSLPL